jgi:hypothetical protein
MSGDNSQGWGDVTINELAHGRVEWHDLHRSLRILDLSWGRMEVEGLGVGKDFKLFPSGGRSWDWAITGTAHEPGIRPQDVDDLLIYGATVVVLSRGMEQRLQVQQTTVEYLESKSIVVHVAETREAVRIYNELAETTPVGGLFHSTC